MNVVALEGGFSLEIIMLVTSRLLSILKSLTIDNRVYMEPRLLTTLVM